MARTSKIMLNKLVQNVESRINEFTYRAEECEEEIRIRQLLVDGDFQAAYNVIRNLSEERNSAIS